MIRKASPKELEEVGAKLIKPTVERMDSRLAVLGAEVERLSAAVAGMEKVAEAQREKQKNLELRLRGHSNKVLRRLSELENQRR